MGGVTFDTNIFGPVEQFDVAKGVQPHALEAIKICNALCIGITLVLVGWRVFLRSKRNIINAEDYLLILAWIIYATSMSLELAAAIYRERVNARYIDVVRLATVQGPTTVQDIYAGIYTMHLFWAMKLLYHTPLYLVKFAWIKFYYALVPEVLSTTRFVLHGIFTFTLVGYICTFVLVASACDTSFWDVECDLSSGVGANNCFQDYIGMSKYCSPFLKIHVVIPVFVFHALSEIMVYTLPLCVIFRLPNLTLRKKISVSALFFLGFFCLFLMVFNMVLSSSLFGSRLSIVQDPVKTAVFWPLEPAWAIIVTCLPAFRVLIDTSIRKIRSPSPSGKGTDSLDSGVCSPVIENRMITVLSEKSIEEGVKSSDTDMMDDKRASIRILSQV
ncbi:hypothetical protein H072_7675 [Dactylellina haptotyla CBS 200.50]|uniref:Rhodopsin domain-containing protein n=1 Tax=Dactylellina haptotyla (strain CBS 200.50) TaxID=1284197 RepID=S8A6E3_DACHA|nr:hypothetical protein H072_7675 [Dactylellina haptotyla CBS 200.50]